MVKTGIYVIVVVVNYIILKIKNNYFFLLYLRISKSAQKVNSSYILDFVYCLYNDVSSIISLMDSTNSLNSLTDFSNNI